MVAAGLSAVALAAGAVNARLPKPSPQDAHPCLNLGLFEVASEDREAAAALFTDAFAKNDWRCESTFVFDDSLSVRCLRGAEMLYTDNICAIGVENGFRYFYSISNADTGVRTYHQFEAYVRPVISDDFSPLTYE